MSDNLNEQIKTNNMTINSTLSAVVIVGSIFFCVALPFYGLYILAKKISEHCKKDSA